jgi:hypothetical protein
MLNRINPYLWWAAAIVWSLIVFFMVRGWLRGHIEAAQQVPVPADTFSDLVNELSDEVIGVMRWSWGSREEPFTIGDLQRTLWEIRHGRIAKIAMVQEQEGLLGMTPAGGSPRGPGGLERLQRGERPELAERDNQDRPGERRRAPRLGDADRPVEPRIGPVK